MRQYKRAYELTITTSDGDVRIIRDLRISFDITKSTLGIPNMAIIELHNPNNATLVALQKKYTKISLNAGYEGSLRLIFKGDVRNVFQPHGGVDRSAIVYSGDGHRDWLNSTFNKTFAESVSIKTAIIDVIKSFKNLTIGIIEGVPDVADKLLGQTLSGSSKDILDTFAGQYGFEWSIQDGEINVVPIEEPLTGTDAIVITSATGMIGSPTITEIGVDVTTLLNPRIAPNVAFKIESIASTSALPNLTRREVRKTNATGLYKVREVMFKGDSREGAWLATIRGSTIRV